MNRILKIVTVALFFSVMTENAVFPFEQRLYFVPLSSDRVVPPVETDNRGLFVLFIDEQNDRLIFSLKVNGPINLTQASLQLGKKGLNGPVVAPLIPRPILNPSLRATREILLRRSLTAKDFVGPLMRSNFNNFVNLIRQGEIYAQLNSLEYPAGELRGQIE